MGKKRIIPCLDLQGGEVVKGVQFTDIKKAGDPVELAIAYEKAGADELVILDIKGKAEERPSLLQLIGAIKEKISIPLIIGGGIKTLADAEMLLAAGADKVSISSGAVVNPKLIAETAQKFGSEKIILAIDAKKKEKNWEVYTGGGRQATGLDVIEWAKEAVRLGAGEILLTSIDQDGTKDGYDLELTKRVKETSGVPVIASGGAGSMEDLLNGVLLGKADGVLAASIFHFGTVSIEATKSLFRQQGIEV